MTSSPAGVRCRLRFSGRPIDNMITLQWHGSSRTRTHTHARTHTHHSRTHTLTHSLTHALTHSLTHSLMHSLTHSLSHSLACSLSLSLPLSCSLSLSLVRGQRTCSKNGAERQLKSLCSSNGCRKRGQEKGAHLKVSCCTGFVSVCYLTLISVLDRFQTSFLLHKASSRIARKSQPQQLRV